ncbi:protein-S-isoprenylcysteine O-methyltransferase [Rhodopirellula baltica SH28]|uniref:Protein-S-isoprenylcysteine O-methyltransferase n=1 Tax=Rhodopirellula baltica SH28 TaxID=993517 RepID=K5CJY2_RHOBT|nr:methyltransferase [Rhodopirellula baltica]EKK04385.1 protein-S-isoprenylcysteine O-methyltransferase [Rhodopirellula baltica SH28]
MTDCNEKQSSDGETTVSDTPVRIVSAYLVVQAIGTLGWWMLLLVYPASIQWFQPASWPDGSLLSFWMADFVLIVAGSLLAAICVWRRTSSAATLVWVIAAVTWYPTLVCIATSLQTGEAWIASAMMVCMAGLSLAMATIHGNDSQSPMTIRIASMSPQVALAMTLAQTVIFWGTFLWVLPMGIVELQQRLGWQVFQHPLQTTLSIGLFLVASSLGLWSGITMAICGDGTPLPTATAPRLVIAGPYRYVRNPMALAGIAQGLAVGWFLGSIPVIVYSLCGAVVWHVFVRPVEECDLQLRFGEDYHRYQKHVRLWIPTAPFS